MSNEIKPNTIWKLKEYDQDPDAYHYVIVISTTIEDEQQGWNRVTKVVNFKELKDGLIDFVRYSNFIYWYEYVQ